jgi:hypothetical protein
MSKARDLANAGTALTTVSATELGYLDGVTSAVQTQINAKEATLPDQTGNTGKYLTTNGTAKSWGTVSQYALPSQTGNSGKFLTTNGTSESWGTVTTPITWTGRYSGPGGAVNRIAYGNGLWVAGLSGGTILTSPDGITWTSRTSQFGATDINDVAYGNGTWVAVGPGKISSSSDGITWTARTANMSTNDIYSVVYANSVWVAVGAGGGTTNTGGIVYSTDGITWTRKSQSLTVGPTYRGLVWNGTYWIVGANNSTNNHLYATTPSGTWTVGSTGQGGTIYKIFWDGTRHIVNEGQEWFFSTSLTLGATTPYYYGNAPAVNAKKEALYSGKMYWQANSTPYYIVGFTVGSSTYPLGINPIVNPGGTFGDNTGALWIGAAGTIVGTASGQIYTSF